MTQRKLPRLIVSGYEIEIRPLHRFPWWSRWEGRVVGLRRWDSSSEWHTVHRYPVIQVHGLVGGEGFWFASRSKSRLDRRLRRWVDAQKREQARKRAVEVKAA